MDFPKGRTAGLRENHLESFSCTLLLEASFLSPVLNLNHSCPFRCSIENLFLIECLCLGSSTLTLSCKNGSGI